MNFISEKTRSHAAEFGMSSDGTRQNPHDADGDLKGVAAIERGEMREPMMSDARRVRSLTRRSKRLADALLTTLVD